MSLKETFNINLLDSGFMLKIVSCIIMLSLYACDLHR